MAKILVVDDDPGILRVSSVILEIAGHEVKTAVEGKEAVKLAGQGEFDLILTDILMPGMDGIEMIRSLRNRSGVKIIAMSGGGRVGPGNYLDMALKLGASGILSKPFGEPELLAAVNEALKTD